MPFETNADTRPTLLRFERVRTNIWLLWRTRIWLRPLLLRMADLCSRLRARFRCPPFLGGPSCWLWASRSVWRRSQRRLRWWSRGRIRRRWSWGRVRRWPWRRRASLIAGDEAALNQDSFLRQLHTHGLFLSAVRKVQQLTSATAGLAASG